MGGGFGPNSGGSNFSTNVTPGPTVAPAPSMTISDQTVAPTESAMMGGATPFMVEGEEPELTPGEAAFAVMILVLSIACPAILFIAFIGFIIWLIVKMSSQPSYRTY